MMNLIITLKKKETSQPQFRKPQYILCCNSDCCGIRMNKIEETLSSASKNSIKLVYLSGHNLLVRKFIAQSKDIIHWIY